MESFWFHYNISLYLKYSELESNLSFPDVLSQKYRKGSFFMSPEEMIKQRSI